METEKIIKFSIWLILTIVIIEVILTMINTSCTIVNLLSILLIITYLTISIKTKCLTNLKLKKKLKKDEKIN